MLAKEWRDNRPLFLTGALCYVALATSMLMSYRQIVDVVEFSRAERANGAPVPGDLLDPTRMALGEMSLAQGVVGGTVLGLLGGLVGAILVSREVRENTIFWLLSRPVSRTRALLTKYSVCAGALLALSALGSFELIAIAWAKGYPVGSVSFAGVVLSTVLVWLGSLSILGVALLFSVLFGRVLASIVATGVVAYLMCAGPGYVIQVLQTYLWDEQRALTFPYAAVDKFVLPFHWFSEASYMGKGISVADFLICLIAAAVPLFAALWLFQRKAY
jgi:ABC-type transport system involved in multi-copper enzyme maturation permease subunit